MAASTALPPARSTSRPAAVARECGEVTMPLGAIVAGRPVRIVWYFVRSMHVYTHETSAAHLGDVTRIENSARGAVRDLLELPVTALSDGRSSLMAAGA